MEIALTSHAIDEFKRHLKLKGDIEWLIRNISNFFLERPMLVKAKSFSLPRRGKSSKFKGISYYLARSSWKNSPCFLLMKKNNENFKAVTSLSGREFRKSVKRKTISDVSESEIQEPIIFKHQMKGKEWIEYSNRQEF